MKYADTRIPMLIFLISLTSTFSCEQVVTTPTGTPSTPVTQPAQPANDLFCKFRWGMNWGNGTIPGNIDMISIWVGYEQDDGMNPAVTEMLEYVRNNDRITPVYYAYFIAFKANIRDGLGDCNTDFDGHNLCNEGAQWIRTNHNYILSVYDAYARMTAEVIGTQKPIIWLIEPDFIQYTYEDQTQPYSTGEIAAIAEEIIDTIKRRLPKAVISLFHATWTYDMAAYWAPFNLSKVDMINTTGMANTNGYFNNGYAYNREGATYANLHRITGKPIFVDTSFGVTEQNNTWSNASVTTLNQRISDGVFAALIEPPPGNYQNQIEVFSPQLESPCR